MEDNNKNEEQLKAAVQVIAQVADRAMVDGPTGRQRDQAIQILAHHFGLSDKPAEQPEIVMPEEASSESNWRYKGFS